MDEGLAERKLGILREIVEDVVDEHLHAAFGVAQIVEMREALQRLRGERAREPGARRAHLHRETLRVAAYVVLHLAGLEREAIGRDGDRRHGDGLGERRELVDDGEPQRHGGG